MIGGMSGRTGYEQAPARRPEIVNSLNIGARRQAPTPELPRKYQLSIDPSALFLRTLFDIRVHDGF